MSRTCGCHAACKVILTARLRRCPTVLTENIATPERAFKGQTERLLPVMIECNRGALKQAYAYFPPLFLTHAPLK